VVVKIVFGLIGGLGLFLFGMKFLSDALRNASSERIKKILGFLTKNPVIGLAMGAGITALIQSSSATTVITVGLVNAGLISLTQALSVVLGANIGTTLTAWIVASMGVFKIQLYAMPAIGIGFFMMNYSRSFRWRQAGEIFFGFGILFFGLIIMKDASHPIAQHPGIKDFFLVFSQYPILGVLAGTVFTILVQSSSATVAVVQALAWQGLLDFNAAIPLILGDNIGTTITAQLASLQTNLTARRTAMAHTLVNVIGVGYILIFVYNGWYARLIEWLLPGEISTSNIMVHIALSHTVFNVFNSCILFLPLIKSLERLVIWILPAKTGEDPQRPQYLESHLLEEPSIALQQSKKEIVRMARLAETAVHDVFTGFFQRNQKILERVGDKEQAIDNFQNEITAYLVELSQRNLSTAEARQLPVLMHSVNDLERIGDHAVNLMELAERYLRLELKLNEHAVEELREMAEQIRNMLKEVIQALQHNDLDAARHILVQENSLDRHYEQLKESNLIRLNQRQCQPLAGIVFVDFINNLEKIGDHITNIGQAVLKAYQWR